MLVCLVLLFCGASLGCRVGPSLNPFGLLTGSVVGDSRPNKGLCLVGLEVFALAGSFR
jgi:hypothetical protein